MSEGSSGWEKERKARIMAKIPEALAFVESLTAEQIDDFEYATHYDSDGRKVHRFVVTVKKVIP